MGQYVEPNKEYTEELLGMLYGGEVDAAKIDSLGCDSAYTATFINPEGQLVAVCQNDPGMVIFSGAALSMLPPGGAEDMVAEKEYTKTVLDNFHEVMNICTRLLMDNNSAHLKLEGVYPGADVADKVEALKGSASSITYEVKIPKYGKGRMEFIFT